MAFLCLWAGYRTEAHRSSRSFGSCHVFCQSNATLSWFAGMITRAQAMTALRSFDDRITYRWLSWGFWSLAPVYPSAIHLPLDVISEAVLLGQDGCLKAGNAGALTVGGGEGGTVFFLYLMNSCII